MTGRTPIVLAEAVRVVRPPHATDLPAERRLRRRNPFAGEVAAEDRWGESGGAAPLPPTLI